MKILRVAADIYPEVVGGVGLHVHNMSKQQAYFGNDVTVFTAGNNKDCFKDGYQLIHYNPWMKLLGNSIMPNMFFSLFKNRYNFDVIHAHSHLYFSTNLCALLKKIGSAPLVITNHGLNSQTAPEWFQKFYTATGAKFTFKAADKIICYTESEKKELIGLNIPANKIEVIHNGIDTNHFIPGNGLSTGSKSLLWIGRYAKGKGVDYLLDAFEIILKSHPDISLTMVGKGPDKERVIKKINDMGVSKNINVVDFVSNHKIVQLYHKASIFVLPSLEEGVPRTILESMSCGVPVVCSALPQLVDIVEGGGFVVPTKDSRALADRISEIIGDSELARTLGENGRTKVETFYSWDDTVNRTIDLYNRLI